MSLRQESNGVLVMDLADEPEFSADIQSLADRLAAYGPASLVVNMASVTLLNSSQWAALVQVRQQLNSANKQMFLCSLPSRLLGALKMSGLDRAFTCVTDMKAARASLQAGPGTV